jgi:signal transduction histidine kinase
VRNLRLQSIIQLTVGALIAALLASGAVAVLERNTVGAAEREMRNRLLPAQGAAAALRKAYIDQETGQRGYLLAGEQSFLQPYVAGRAAATRATAQLRTLVASDAPSRRALAGIAAAAQRWQTGAAEPQIAAQRSGPVNESRLKAMALIGEALFNRLRGRLDVLAARTVELVQAQLRRIRAAQSEANVATATAVLLALLFGAVSVALLRRLLGRPLQRLVGEVSAVAEGGYDRRIETAGPQEINTIAFAVEKMRHNLVHNTRQLVDAEHELTQRDERDRMAGELHDLTIRRVFSLSLAMSSAIGRRPDIAPVIDPFLAETDAIIRELRGVIFGIRHDDNPDCTTAQIKTIVGDSAPVLGFTPRLDLQGPIDQAVTAEQAAALFATLRESLADTARHSEASEAKVNLLASGDELRLRVTDNRTRLEAPDLRRACMEGAVARASQLGGSVSFLPSPDGGAVIDWRVPRVSG